jgi:hypothetical protein
MAHTRPVPKVKLRIGVMYNDIFLLDKVIAALKQKFGEVDSELDYDFSFTDYYDAEMGSSIRKRLVVFRELMDRNILAGIKNWTNTLEDKESIYGKRKINLDPGYLTVCNVVLASAKEMPHKVYIGDGMFGDVVLEYRNKSFQHSDHTFPDYRSDIVKNFLNKVRESCKRQLRET